MTIPTLVACGILIVIGILSFWVFGSVFFHFFYVPYKIKVTEKGLDEVLSVIASMIRTEVDLMEKSVFKTRGSIDNSNFENYYYMACNEILNGISSDFWNRILMYYTKEAAIQLVSTSISNYLSEKVH